MINHFRISFLFRRDLNLIVKPKFITHYPIHVPNMSFHETHVVELNLA